MTQQDVDLAVGYLSGPLVDGWYLNRSFWWRSSSGKSFGKPIVAWIVEWVVADMCVVKLGSPLCESVIARVVEWVVTDVGVIERRGSLPKGVINTWKSQGLNTTQGNEARENS